jgi:RimJ/RimL family protein N-acetyltransferase
VVDGKGVDRVCAAMLVIEPSTLGARRARACDESMLLEWANDPVTRQSGFAPQAISTSTHHTWFRDRLRNPDGCCFYVVEHSSGVPIGQVRFERSGDGWEIHFALAPEYRGRGLGCKMVNAALEKMRHETDGGLVFGQVRQGNLPSRRLFQRLGFATRPGEREGTLVYQRRV